ncbi:MAG TPA: FABP family protein [Propionibacterium sp.]|nr:FABP family protein [Propionibacterium sp.]
MDLHPNVASLAPLLGTWRGKGRGEYPTITSFEYADEWTFSHSGKPFVSFVQSTRSAEGKPMHTESGYLRGTGDGAIEIVAALPTGQVEIGGGRADEAAGVLTLTTDASVTNTPTAKTVERVTRSYRVEGDVLDIDLAMAAVGQELGHHLASRLTRDTMPT